MPQTARDWGIACSAIHGGMRIGTASRKIVTTERDDYVFYRKSSAAILIAPSVLAYASRFRACDIAIALQFLKPTFVSTIWPRFSADSPISQTTSRPFA